jgi:hypothetical protein
MHRILEIFIEVPDCRKMVDAGAHTDFVVARNDTGEYSGLLLNDFEWQRGMRVLREKRDFSDGRMRPQQFQQFLVALYVRPVQRAHAQRKSSFHDSFSALMFRMQKEYGRS